MNTFLETKISQAIKKSRSLSIIKEHEFNLRLPYATLTNSVRKETGIIQIPVDKEFVLVDELKNKIKLIRLMIGLKKNKGGKLSIGVVEILNKHMWSNPSMAKRYFQARTDELEKDENISVTDSSMSSDLMYLQYKIDFESDDIEVVAHLVEAIKYAVNQSARRFNRWFIRG